MSLMVACGSDDGFVDASADSSLSDAGATPDSGPLPDSAPPSDADPPADSGTPSDSGPPSDSGSLPDSAPPSDAAAPANGAFRFLTYNVAGLPGVISGSDPAVNTPLISPLLNAYDIVVAQEDFTYHADLIGAATHTYTSGPGPTPVGRTIGDGLGRLSVFPFADFERQQWDECNGIFGSGTDCLAGKGFSMASHEIATGLTVHVYNLHMDAGRSSDDYDARAAQSTQLRSYLATRSAGATVIVAGDTNMKDADEALVVELLSMAGLTDACRTLSCPDPSGHDRVMFRNGPDLELTPTLWQEDARFVDGSGDDLSDHPAVGVDFDWRRTAAP